MKKAIARVLLLLIGIGLACFIFGSIKDATASSDSEVICKNIRNGMTDSQIKASPRNTVVGSTALMNAK